MQGVRGMDKVDHKTVQQQSLLAINKLPGGVGILQLGQSVEVQYMSRGLAKLLGYSAAQFKKYRTQSMLDVVHPLDLDRVQSKLLSHAHNRKALDLEFRLSVKKNRWIRLQGRCSRQDESSSLYYVVASDITEAKENALKLEMVHARLQFALTHSTLEIWEYRIKEDSIQTLTPTICSGHPALRFNNPSTYLLEQGFVHPQFSKTVEYDFMLLKERTAVTSIMRVRALDGQFRWMKISYSFMHDAIDVALGMFQDVDDEIETRLHLIGEECIFFAAFDIETGRPVLADNQSWDWFGGLDANLFESYDELFERAIGKYPPKEFETIKTVEALRSFLATSQKELVIEAKMIHPFKMNEGKRWYRFYLSCSSSNTGSFVYIGIKDIDQTKQETLLLQSRAQFDPLTRLLNRYSLEDTVSNTLMHAEQSSVAFFLIDIDNFKQVNDTWGHKIGDRVLIRLAALMKLHFPHDSLIGRLGGDEFVVCCCVADDVQHAFTLGRDFCNLVSRDAEMVGPVTVSIGLSLKSEAEASFSELYQHADVALYEAKDQGRNRCLVYKSRMGLKKVVSWSNHQMVLDSLSDVVYVCDLESYELLFLNKEGRVLFGCDQPYSQKKCYEVLYNRQSVCPFCKFNSLSYDHFLFWVHETEDGKSLLYKEKLVLIHNRTVKLTVLVDQVKQSSDISKTIYAQKPVQHTALVQYLQLINFGGQSWDYDLKYDILTFQVFKEGKVETLQVHSYLKQGKMPNFLHPEDGLLLRDYIAMKTMKENNEPIVVRIQETLHSYKPIMLTSYLALDDTQTICRVGGLIVPFVSFGFAEQPRYLLEFFNALSVGMITFSYEEHNATLLFYNDEFLRMFAVKVEDLVKDPLLWLSSDEKDLVFERIQSLLSSDMRYETYQLQQQNQRTLSITCYLGPSFSRSRTVSLSMMDIGNLTKLKRYNQNLQLFMDQSLQGIGVFRLRPDSLHLEYVNETLAKILGYERKELTRQLLENGMQIFYHEDRSLLLSRIEKYILTSDKDEPFRLRLLGKQKQLIWCEIVFRQIGKKGKSEPFSLLFTDITQKLLDERMLQQTMQQLSYALSHNLTTGLYTRQKFCEQVRLLLDENIDDSFYIVYWNVERFSVVNELLGYESGNQVLQLIATSMRTYFSGKSLCCYGHLESDHFAAVLKCTDCTTLQLQQLIDLKAIRDSIGFAMTVAIGVYLIEDNTLQVSQLIDRAHSAAKNSRRQFEHNVSLYKPSFRSDTFNEQEVLNQMQGALDEGQFTFYLQPIYSVEHGHIVSAEALARWIHPSRGVIEPIQFIPVFERYGFITTFDLYLMDKVCDFLQDQRSQGHTVVPISINLSRVDLSNREIVNMIAQTIEPYDFDRSLLQLEVTESCYMDNPEHLLQALQSLKQLGFTILMDDFGSGYSSLHMLYTLALDVLKIDRIFLVDLNEEPRSIPVLKAIVQLAKGLGLPVIAEGVETEDQLQCLKRLDCDFAQGYYLCKPVEQETFISLLHG